MSRKKYIFLALLSIFLLVGCSNKIENKGENISSQVENTSTIVKDKKQELELIDLDTGEKIGNEILQAEYNFLVLWQPQCSNCETMARAIETFYKDLENSKFIGLGVGEIEDLKECEKQWNSTIKSYKVTDQFLDKILKRGISSTPVVFILDKNGEEITEPIIGVDDNSSDVDKLAEKLKDKYKKIISGD